MAALSARKLLPYALLVSLVGAAGQIVVALQFREYLWAALVATHTVYCPLLILEAAHRLDACGSERAGTPARLALSVAAGCFAAQVLMIEIGRLLIGSESIAQKG